MASALRVLVSGMFANTPRMGGATWAALQYALGLRRLGHDVHIVEPISPGALQPAGSSLESSLNARYFGQVMQAFDLDGDSTLVLAGTTETSGLAYEELRDLAGATDLLVNLNGILGNRGLIGRIPIRAYVDIDAGFNQLWHSIGKDRRFDAHTHHVTIGQGIGEPWSPVPTCGIDWIKIVQPVVLDQWPVATTVVDDALTTVGNWRSSGPFEFEGRLVGQKAHSLRTLLSLPSRTRERFLLALAIHPTETDDLAALRENGWELVDPLEVASTPADYRRFVQGSKAEFGLVQHGCLSFPCGWFSDRSACYLASGRPVIAQDTGFGRWLPTGEGVFAVTSEDDALRAIDALNSDYAAHARAARALAEAHFDSDRVLAPMLEHLGC